MPRPLVVNSQVVIPDSELVISFVRSSGPGGQNVNKVSSKAVLRWNLRASKSLSEEAKLRFESCFPTRISQAGDVLVSSDQYRDQGRNLANCYEKLRQMIQAVLVMPRKRRPTRPSRSSVEGRLAKKKEKSELKRGRSFRREDDH